MGRREGRGVLRVEGMRGVRRRRMFERCILVCGQG